MGRLIVYGDIHGCLDEFITLRKKIGIRSDDEEICLGDFLDRGAHSLEVLRYLRKNHIKSILGNHERKYIQYKSYKESLKTKRSAPKLDEEQLGLYEELNEEDFEYLKKLPYYLKRGEITLIHAGITNKIELNETTPKKDLEKLTWIRYLDKSENPLALNQESEDDKLWSYYYNGSQGYIVYGHNVFDKVREDQHALGIDTGCVYGGKLSAAIFEDISNPQNKTIEEVDCKCKKEIPKGTVLNTIYPFKFNGEIKVDAYKKIDKNSFNIKSFLPYIYSIFSAIYKHNRPNYYTISKYGELRLKDRYIFQGNNGICLLLQQYETIIDMSKEDYVALHKNLTVLHDQNKDKLLIINANVSIKYPLTKVYPSKDGKLEIETNKLYEKYIKNSYKEMETIRKGFETKFLTLKEYIADIIEPFTKIDEIEAKNLSSYHLIKDSCDLKLNFFEAITQYRGKIDENSNKPCNIPFKKQITSSITSYASGQVVLHSFNNSMNNNIIANYKNKHLYSFLVALLQLESMIVLISDSIKTVDDKNIQDVKLKNLNFLTDINFEKISTLMIEQEIYKFYRDSLEINSLKNEVITIVDKVSEEISKEKEDKLNLILLILAFVSVLSTVIDVLNYFNLR